MLKKYSIMFLIVAIAGYIMMAGCTGGGGGASPTPGDGEPLPGEGTIADDDGTTGGNVPIPEPGGDIINPEECSIDKDWAAIFSCDPNPAPEDDGKYVSFDDGMERLKTDIFPNMTDEARLAIGKCVAQQECAREYDTKVANCISEETFTASGEVCGYTVPDKCSNDTNWAEMFPCTDAPPDFVNDIETVLYISYAEYLSQSQSHQDQSFTPQMLECIAQHECNSSNYADKISDCISSVTIFDAVDECGYSDLISTRCRPDNNWSEVYSCTAPPAGAAEDQYVSFDRGIEKLRTLYGKSKSELEIQKMAHCIAFYDCDNNVTSEAPGCLSEASYLNAAQRCGYEVQEIGHTSKLQHINPDGSRNPATQGLIYTYPITEDPAQIAFSLMAHYSKDPEENISDYQYTLCAVEPGTNDCGSGNAFFPVSQNVKDQLAACTGQSECKVDIVWGDDATSYMLQYKLHDGVFWDRTCVTSSWEWDIGRISGDTKKEHIAASGLLIVKMEMESEVCSQQQ